MKLMRQCLALEEDSSGVAKEEIEHVFYAKLANMLDLKKATSYEHQEQWELKLPLTDKNASDGSIRIRKTVKPDQDPEYVITTKTRTNKDNDRIEVSVPTTDVNFKQFQLLSPRGMRKDRYHFPVPDSNLVWEVDMFLKPGSDTEYFEWCKIDLEVTDKSQPLPEFPIDFVGVIQQSPDMPLDQKNAVDQLYEEVFILKNIYRSPE